MNVSAGFVAGIRGKAARLLAPFMNRVRELLPAAPVLYAAETPARAAGTLHYVHVACTEFLTAMHTGDRTSEAIDSGGILPGYPGTIVRDGYKVRAVGPATGSVRAGREIVVPRCAREPVTGVASLSHRGGTAWPILTAEARCWILTRTLR